MTRGRRWWRCICWWRSLSSTTWWTWWIIRPARGSSWLGNVIVELFLGKLSNFTPYFFWRVHTESFLISASVWAIHEDATNDAHWESQQEDKYEDIRDWQLLKVSFEIELNWIDWIVWGIVNFCAKVLFSWNVMISTFQTKFKNQYWIQNLNIVRPVNAL